MQNEHNEITEMNMNFNFGPIDHKIRDEYLHYCSNIRTCCHTCMYQRDSEQEKYLRKYLKTI